MPQRPPSFVRANLVGSNLTARKDEPGQERSENSGQDPLEERFRVESQSLLLCPWGCPNSFPGNYLQWTSPLFRTGRTAVIAESLKSAACRCRGAHFSNSSRRQKLPVS